MHSGHRQRMRDRIKEHGLESLNDHEILEYLLYFVQPRVNTNEPAHRLIRECGSFSKVFDRHADSLAQVDGIGPASAQFLSLIPEICRRYYLGKYSGKRQQHSMERILEYLKSYYLGVKEEIAVILMYDAQMDMICAKTIAKGNSRAVNLQKKNILLEVIQNNASFVVFSHNHPSNKNEPSAEDIVLSNHLATLFESVNIVLIDHLIFCPNGSYYSFAKSCTL